MPTLDGLRVLVTRPTHQAPPLCRAIEAEGGNPLPFPVIAIEATAPSLQRDTLLERIGQFDIALFISANAVHHGLPLLRLDGRLPERLAIAAVGKGTAHAIREQLGRPADIVPTDRFDSEGLLALPALQQVDGKRVIIVRGVGGRELLAETLRERGAEVDYLEAYRRVLPSPPAVWPGTPDVVVVTSSEGLDNLLTLAPEPLQSKPLLVVSERTATHARQRGFEQVFVSANAGGDALLDTLSAIAATARPQ